MFKKGFLIFCTMLFLFVLCSCSSGGNITQVSKTIDNSDIYTTEDVESAMNVVTNYFKKTKGFQNCTLTKLYYNDKKSCNEMESWAEQYEAEEAIVLFSDFDVGEAKESSGLNPDSTYNNFKWILVRSNHGAWSLETWGY